MVYPPIPTPNANPMAPNANPMAPGGNLGPLAAANANANASSGTQVIQPPIRAPRPRVNYLNFTPDEEERLADQGVASLVVFGSPRIIQGAGEYDLRLLAAQRRIRSREQPIDRRRIANIATWESFLVRPNAVLRNLLASMSANPIISPQDPVDPATQCCSCGQCPDGIAATQECKFLTIFRREQRFRRRAATSLVIGAINRWHM